MWKLSDILLQKDAKLNNTTWPHSDFIAADEYPEQNTELLNSEVVLKFRNYYKCNFKSALEKTATVTTDEGVESLRPHDDIQFTRFRELVGPDYDDSSDYDTKTFKVVRADLNEPNVFIGISTDYEAIIIGSTIINEMEHYSFLDDYNIYGIQLNEYFGSTIRTHYMNDSFVDDKYYEAKILRIDAVNPLLTVVVELLDNNIGRFVLADEVTIILDNKNTSEEVLESMIPEYRKSILEGIIPYGTV